MSNLEELEKTMNEFYEQTEARMQDAPIDEAIQDMRLALQDLRSIIITLQEIGDINKIRKLIEADKYLSDYLKIAEAYVASCRMFPGDPRKRDDFVRRRIQIQMEYARAESAKRRKDLITELRKQVEYEHHEAEKNLRLLNEARGVVWHSVADELPSENGTYLVVGKSGTVCTAHFYPEHKIPSTEYAIIHGHFNNRYVRFWAKLPEPPIQDQDYQHTDNK